MTPRLAVVLAVALSACAHTSLGVGYDTASRGGGVLAPVMGQTGTTGSIAYGVGAGPVRVQVVVAGQHLDFSPAGDRFVAASAALELRARVYRLGRFGLIAHGGPSRGMVFDKQMLDVTWGVGYRVGSGVEMTVGPVAVWADLHREDLVFGGQVVNGRGNVQGATFGVTLGR